MIKVLLTGGAGYIGSHIALALAEKGFEPVLVDNYSNSLPWISDRISQLAGKKIPSYEADCRDVIAMKEIVKNEGKIDAIVHLAAFKAVGESVQNPLKYYRNNINGTAAILQLMSDCSIHRLVFSSSCTVYGSTTKTEVFESDAWSEANNPYGYSKQVCERMMSDLSVVQSGWKQVSLRYFNPIGAHPSGMLGELPIGIPNNLVPYITQTAAGIRERLTIFGDDYSTHDGTCVRDYIHVMDVASAHVMALEYVLKENAPPIDQFNIGTGSGLSVKELVGNFEKVTGVLLPKIIGPRRLGDADAIYANVAKASKKIGWHAEFSIMDALYHAWLWQQHLSSNSK